MKKDELETKMVLFVVYDHNRISRNEPIGQVAVSLRGVEFNSLASGLYQHWACLQTYGACLNEVWLHVNE